VAKMAFARFCFTRHAFGERQHLVLPVLTVLLRQREAGVGPVEPPEVAPVFAARRSAIVHPRPV
jgi:hypothetical protein